MDIAFRLARADDRGPVAELIHSSGPEFYNYLHRGAALDFLRHELGTDRGFTGHSRVTVAVLDGEVVGTGCFYDREQYGVYTRETVKNALGFYGVLRAAPVLWRARNANSIIRRPKPGEIYLANFGVVPRLRSQGIGRRLLAHALEQARRRGYRSFGLDVSVNNPRGQALYERLGMQMRKEKPFSDPRAGVPSARKMEMPL